jgi:hypothetical protein
LLDFFISRKQMSALSSVSSQENCFSFKLPTALWKINKKTV